MLKTGAVVAATIIAAPSASENSSGERDPETQQTTKGNQWHFGMKTHTGVDADSGQVRSVVGKATNVNDVTQAGALMHGEETDVFADAGNHVVARREETQGIEANWHMAMPPYKRKVLDKSTPMGSKLRGWRRFRHVPWGKWSTRFAGLSSVILSWPRTSRS